MTDLTSPQQSLSIARLQRREQFLAAARGAACARGAVLVQLLARPERAAPPSIGCGFTASKKVGKAVDRNRAKRRLREAARHLLPLHGRPGFDYVFVARSGAPSRPWPRLLDDVKSALIRLASETGAPSVRPAQTGVAPSQAPE